MQSDLSPNFKPKNIVKSISKAINLGQAQSSLASQGKDWESVIDVLDQAEHNIGREMSVNSHLNSVMFSDDFNKQYEKTQPYLQNDDPLPARERLQSPEDRAKLDFVTYQLYSFCHGSCNKNCSNLFSVNNVRSWIESNNKRFY